MTIEELITELEKFPMTAKVWTEGCDCHGEAKGVEVNGDLQVLITRE